MPPPPGAENPFNPVQLGGKSLRVLKANESALAPGMERGATPKPIRKEPPPPSEAAPNPPGVEVMSEQRKKWASLLWGEPEEGEEAPEEPLPPRKAAPDTPPPVRRDATAAPETANAQTRDRNEQSATRQSVRRTCCFPGMLKLLVPEETFTPRQLAIRIVDLSPMGARLETRQLSPDLVTFINRAPRHLRIEAMLPRRERIVIPGKLAWARYSPDLSAMGVAFDARRDDLLEVFLPDHMTQQDQRVDTRVLSSPQLDAFPNLTDKTAILFLGTVENAEEIIVRNGHFRAQVPVVAGRFEVEVKLRENRANAITFTAAHGGLLSVPTPVLVVQRLDSDSPVKPRWRTPTIEALQVQEEGTKMTCRLRGTPSQWIDTIRALEEVVSLGDEWRMIFELRGPAETAVERLKLPQGTGG